MMIVIRVAAAVWMLGVGVVVLAQPQARAQAPASTQGQAQPLARTPPLAQTPTETAAVARGRQLYSQNCAACHGTDGRGGADAGADLSRSPIAGARDEGGQLGAFLKVGRPERRMPSFALADADVVALAAFLRTLAPAGGVAPGAGAGAGGPGGGLAGPPRNVINAIVVGNATDGEAYFKGAGGCTTCHSVTGDPKGGDLKGIGARLSVAALQGRMVMPRGMGGYPRSFNAPPDPNDTPRTVTITMPSGETVSGTLLSITDFHVTLTDAAGMRRTVARSAANGGGETPKVEVKDPLQYHIDHMQRLTDKDMHDLTAYLVTLK